MTARETPAETPAAYESTSAAGAMLGPHLREAVLIGCILAGPGTSSAWSPFPEMAPCVPYRREQTTAGVPVSASLSASDPAGAAIGELRRLSGLTWEQLARLFGVSRRSLHFWASGKPMAPSNEEHLQRLLAVVRKLDRGSSSANRAALLGVREDGSLPFDLLAAGQYERVLALLGPGEGRPAMPPRPSVEARAARAPRPPGELVGALQDRIHPASGPLLAAKPVRVPRRK